MNQGLMLKKNSQVVREKVIIKRCIHRLMREALSIHQDAFGVQKFVSQFQCSMTFS